MEVKSKYIVLSNRDTTNPNWETALQETLGICHTFSKAFEIALFLSGITAPAIKYRKALETIKQKGAVRIDSTKEEPPAIIVRVRIY